MQSYKRKITYFYQFHNGMVGSTAGFLKMEIRGDKVKIIINIQEPPGLPYEKATLFFYHETGESLSAVKVADIESKNGMLTYMNRTCWQQLFDTGRDLYTFDGVAVMYNDNHYYIGDFQDRDRRDYKIKIKEGARKIQEEPLKMVGQSEEPLNVVAQPEESSKAVVKSEEETEIEQAPEQEVSGAAELAGTGLLYEKCENCPYQRKHMDKPEQEDAFEKMIEEYPKLPMYGATELFDCVRIHPRDIGRLDMRNWKLGVNSFLTHGFYTYQYLLLGKMRFGDGNTRPIIGVPGVYSNREKYLANMFGFEQFIPVKKTGIKTGEFGYWIVEISPYL